MANVVLDKMVIVVHCLQDPPRRYQNPNDL